MNKVEEITDKGDEYAKRMLVRKRELNQSSECYNSKSLRRRLSIMEAISKNNRLSSSSALSAYVGNPFDREFANTSGICENNDQDKSTISYVHTAKDDLLDTHDPTLRVKLPPQQQKDKSCLSEPYRSLEAIDDNCNSIEYCDSSQFQQDMIGRNQDEKSSEDTDKDHRNAKLSDILREPRMSMGTYFRSSTHIELNMQDFTNGKSFEEEFERGNAELERQGADAFFGARVLDILEPEIVKVERKSVASRTTTAAARRRASDMSFVQEQFGQMRLEKDPTIDESVTTSVLSEDLRDIDREIDKLQFQPDVIEHANRQELQQKISETPKIKGIYPNLDLVRRVSDKFTPKKLFHAAKSTVEKTNETTGPYFNCESTKNLEERPTSAVLERNTEYMTPMPITDSQFNDVEYANQQPQNRLDSSIKSFIKRNASFRISNLRLPKIGHHKPNLESTRKICSSGGKTLSPTSQMGSMISTLTLPNTPSSPDTHDAMTTVHQSKDQLQPHQMFRHVQRNLQDGTLPYEVENFLELALGDEHCNTSVAYTYSEMRDRTDSHINASELISEDRTPPKRGNQATRIPATEPLKNRSTLNRTLTIYKTLTQRIKKKFRGNVKQSQSLQQSQDFLPDINPKDLKDNVKQLLSEVDIQQTLIYQASKALELCSSMRAFIASPERVESERLLILAKLRKKAAQDEISRLTSQSADNGLYCERGELTLKELSLQLREDVLRRERQNGDIAEWFICVVSEGSTVWATQAVECPTSSPRLYFPGQLSIPGLAPDFRLSLTLYSFKMPRQFTYNHEDKYRIQKSYGPHRSTTCPSPKSLLGRSDKRKMLTSPKHHEIRFSGIQESSFVVSGTVDLMLHDLNLKSPWPLTGVPSKSVLHGTIDLSLSCKLELTVSHAGFLTHGDEAGGLAAWNRRWCVLEGHSLLFWNYPREQECKAPLYSIDLVNCVSRRIGLIDRSLCAKPRTLLIETVRSRSAIDRDSILVECRSTCTVIRNLLSCDSNQDLTEWQSKLNHVVSALREWSVIDTKLD